MEKIDKAERVWLRTITKGYSLSNQSLYDEVKRHLPTFAKASADLSSRRFRLLGHTLRRADDHPAKMSLVVCDKSCNLLGKLPQGRPVLGIIDNFIKDCESRGLEYKSAAECAQDRSKWRSLARAGPYT
jgi:hypothetical protein